MFVFANSAMEETLSRCSITYLLKPHINKPIVTVGEWLKQKPPRDGGWGEMSLGWWN